MDPPDVLGMDPGIARPTKLPNRAKSKFGISLCFLYLAQLSVNPEPASSCFQNKLRPALRSPPSF